MASKYFNAKIPRSLAEEIRRHIKNRSYNTPTEFIKFAARFLLKEEKESQTSINHRGYKNHQEEVRK